MRRCIALLILLAGCGNDQPEGEAPRTDTPRTVEASPPAPYEVVEVTEENAGSITGSIRFDGTPPRDSIVRPFSDESVCGVAFVDTTFVARNGRLANAVVWLEDARRGKALPLQRRYQITSQRCRLMPRVQAVAVGGTLNVRSHDRAVHHTRFTREGTDEVIARVSQNDAGQVVPVQDVLREPGRYVASCEAHPWTRAWIAVFDHPYFDLSTPTGEFQMDGVPEGAYTLMVWHERLGVMVRDVVVGAGEESEVEIVWRGQVP
jgi:hypothetical protein